MISSRSGRQRFLGRAPVVRHNSTPAGYWDADDPSAAAAVLVFREGGSPLEGQLEPADRLADRFQRPGLIAELLAGDAVRGTDDGGGRSAEAR